MTIELRPLYHRGKETIAILAPKDGALNAAIRKLPGVKWSQTHRVWYLPWGKDSYAAIVERLQPMAVLDTRLLKAYLAKRNDVQQTLVPVAMAKSGSANPRKQRIPTGCLPKPLRGR